MGDDGRIVAPWCCRLRDRGRHHRPRSTIVRAEQAAADGADVDDAGETGVVDDRQVPEVAVHH